MTDDLAKDYLHRQLRSTRHALVWKLNGLGLFYSEFLAVVG